MSNQTASRRRAVCGAFGCLPSHRVDLSSDHCVSQTRPQRRRSSAVSGSKRRARLDAVEAAETPFIGMEPDFIATKRPSRTYSEF
jgi:hypothetical protein